MSIIKWENEYSVNITTIDNQHRQLIAIINALGKAIESDEENIVFHKIIAYLSAYAQDHFSDEEKMMLNGDYPEYEAHKQQHKAFLRQVDALRMDFYGGNRQAAVQLKLFLEKWLKGHMVKVDQKYSSFLIQKGVI